MTEVPQPFVMSDTIFNIVTVNIKQVDGAPVV